MKVLGIMCSPRKRSNTWVLLNEALSGAKDAGAETDMVVVSELNMRYCDGCYSCQKTGKCHIDDDMQQVYPKMVAADGIIFATPVYFLSVSGQAKVFIDRLCVLNVNQKLVNKVGGAIAVATRTGQTQVWSFFNYFWATNRMIPADFVAAFGREKNDVKRDKHGMKAAEELGRLVVAIARKGFKLPEEYTTFLSRFVTSKYGIDVCPIGNRFEPL